MNKRRFVTGAISIALAVTMLSTTAVAASTSFTDVPDKHWAASAISEMAEKGVVSGVGNNLYAPNQTLSNAEFLTMLVRQFYKDKIGPNGDKWYSAYVAAADAAGIRTGTSTDAEATISRYDMAQLMYNVMKDKGMAITSLSDTSKVSDWASVPTNYQEAVSACYAMGMLSGVDGNGTFNGTGSMDRAQAAVVMDRLIDSQTSLPETPDVPTTGKPDDSVAITEAMFDKSSGASWNAGTIHINPADVSYAVGSFDIYCRQGGTLHWTVRAGDGDVRVQVGTSTAGDMYASVSIVQDSVILAGTEKSFSLDITGLDATFTVSGPEGYIIQEAWFTDLFIS